MAKVQAEVVVRVEIDTEDFDGRGDMEWALLNALRTKVNLWSNIDDMGEDTHYTVRLPEGTVTSLD